MCTTASSLDKLLRAYSIGLTILGKLGSPDKKEKKEAVSVALLALGTLGLSSYFLSPKDI
jgi:hypothetical protein